MGLRVLTATVRLNHEINSISPIPAKNATMTIPTSCAYQFLCMKSCQVTDYSNCPTTTVIKGKLNIKMEKTVKKKVY